LVVVVEGYQRPVCYYASDTDPISRWERARDEVFDCGGVEELDVGEGEDFGEQGGGEERGVLDYDEGWVGGIFGVGDADVAEEGVGWFAEDHGGEELTAEPGAAACGVGFVVSDGKGGEVWGRA